MITYQGIPYRPHYALPVAGPVARMAQANEVSDRPFRPLTAQEIGIVLAAGTAHLILAAATGWVGIHTGIKSKGILSIAGWVTGVVGVLSSVGSLVSTAGTLIVGVPREDSASV